MIMDLLKGKSVKGLFNKQKDDPLFLERQKKARGALLKNLSRAVKEVQLLYTRTEDGVISDCRPVQRLCARFEDVLRHELKSGWLGMSGKPPTFWPVVMKISRKQAIEYINRLQYAQTDNGRCRAWIRLAANECSLESYINVLCQDTYLLSQYYEAHSFLRDEETVSAMKQLLAGVSQISFNITVDTASLEFAPAPEALQPALRIRAPLPMEASGETSGPSSAGTPQASSSDGSWMSNSSSSSSSSIHSNQETGRGGVSNHEKKVAEEKVEVVKVGEGLEASLRQEEDSVVIETVGMVKTDAYSDLRRFSRALEESNDDWMTNEGEEIFDDHRYKRPQFGTAERTVESGGISMKVGEEEEVEQTREETQRDTLLFLNLKEKRGGEDGKENELVSSNLNVSKDPSISPQAPPSPHSTSLLPPSESNEPGLVQSEEDAATQATPLTTPISDDQSTKSDHHITSNSSPHQERSPEMGKQSTVYTQEEYSFNEILRLATGVKSRSLSAEPDDKEREDPGENKASDLFLNGNKKLDLDNDPYAGFGEDIATPKVEGGNNPFFDSPITPLAPGDVSTNPFDEGYVEPKHPNRPTGNPFEEDSLTFGNPSSNPFTPDAESYPPNQFNPFSQPVLTTSNDNSNYYVPQQSQDELLIEEGRGNIVSEDMTAQDNENEYTHNRTSNSLSSLDYAAFDLKENHYHQELSVEEIEVKISKLKVFLQNDNSNKRLQKSLIQLQLLKLKRIEAEEEVNMVKGEVIFGHTFQEMPRWLTGKKCDICNKPLVSILKRCYQCALCGQLAHEKCLRDISRKCVSQALKDRTGYIMEMCPEKSLTHQHFRCESCNQALNKSSVEVRQCDYTGHYYCSDCHHNDLSLIPARVIHDWDFSQRRVCCGCAELLTALELRPLFNIQQINPSLYKYIQDILGVEILRQEILLMKTLLVNCDRAREEKLLQELDPWPHFKDSSDMYSMKDLIGLQNGTLLPQVQAVHRMYTSHVHDECETCSTSGQACKICKNPEKIFKFSKDSTSCQKCLGIFHKSCFPVNGKCPVCSKTRKSVFSTMFT